jgi:homoserine kinase
MPTARVPASTTNLGPGFDALGLALRLYNRVSVERADAPRVEIAGEGERSIYRDHRNLAYRAAQRCLEAAGREPAALAVRLENAIPVGRGLGSSAAAIVGGLAATNALEGGPLPVERLLDLAVEMEGHPDNVTPALLGGFQVAAATDAGLARLQLPFPAGLRVALAVPDYPLPTERARSVLPAFVPRRDAVFNVGRACLLLAALFTGRPDPLGTAMEDRLHQPYRGPLMPGFESALAAARSMGAGASLSGAGPTILALVPGDPTPVAQAMCAALAGAGITARPLTLEVDEEGAVVERAGTE